MQGADNANARPRSLSADGSRIIPPPPSIQGAGNSDATARIRSLSADSSRIIPPPPSIQGAGNSGATAGLGSLSADGSRVIPPPPSMQGAGNSGAAARPGSLSADGSRVIPPPPSIQGAGNPDATARLSSLSADGSHVIPPPPSMQGAGNPDVNERTDSVFREGSQVIPAPPSAESASVPGASGPAKLLEPMDPLPDDTSSPSPDVHNENKPSLEDLPLGLLGVVWVPPGTSYFSNFEVLVAKRRVGKNEMQLIKLVYEFLPYQRRLSEYDLNNQPQRIIKLRVIPDPSCDESLGRMLQANGEPSRPATPYSELPAALRSSDLNAMLPCYRTNADDFRRAMSRAH